MQNGGVQMIAPATSALCLLPSDQSNEARKKHSRFTL
jgi:hypothetical protein